jgi:hypothetical protein
MAYNEVLAERIRKLLARRKGLAERKMFGGIAFMLNGNMCCGVVDDRIVLRLGKDGSDTALKEPHIEVMDFTGRPIRSIGLSRPGRLCSRSGSQTVARSFREVHFLSPEKGVQALIPSFPGT